MTPLFADTVQLVTIHRLSWDELPLILGSFGALTAAFLASIYYLRRRQRPA